MNSVLLFFTVFIVSTTHYYSNGISLNPPGDPAPGRSPGPPNDKLSVNFVKKIDSLDTENIYSDSTSNKNKCELDGTLGSDENGILNFTLNHRLFNTDTLVPGLVYEVVIVRKKFATPLDIILSSSIGNVPFGEFRSLLDFTCGPHTFRSRLYDSSELRLNWTFHDNKEYSKYNVTFRLNYMPEGEPFVYKLIYDFPVLQDCQLDLRTQKAVVTNKDLPYAYNCQVWFPSQENGYGLVIELTKLNVPCSRGFVHFSGLNTSQHTHMEKNYGHIKSHKQAHLCSKLEELAEFDRHIYFPSSFTRPFMYLQGNPVFSISYHLVDHCYNVTFVGKNGSYELSPMGELQCTFRINLPYGYRVALNLKIGDSSSTGSPDTGLNLQDFRNGDHNCDGLLTHLQDGSSSWHHCTRIGDAERHIEILSRENKITLYVTLRNTKTTTSPTNSAFSLYLSYHAEPIESIVGICEFGWVSVRQFCVAPMEGAKLPWAQAEMECQRKGGHLASVRSQVDQELIDKLLLNSPNYRDHNAYWIGGSDKTHEGDFRWSDGLPFSYINWFPGWAQHGHYNKQPNDDGLSDQDCIEVRRIYTLPAATARLTNTFMWNDRDCSTPNYFVCERLQSDDIIEEHWILDCNRTIMLSRNQPKASVSSPGFPRHYPDNANCDIDIVGSPGYRIILDFEELVLENEPSCSYDYLIILENSTSDSDSVTSARRLCGDWSSKLKLLRHVSQGSKLKIRFSSDYSHHFSGFKARVTMENTVQCVDDRFFVFNNSCYLIISYPEVTWNTSQKICESMKSNLASILTSEEERFITTSIRRATEYRTSALYWLGAKVTQEPFSWIDGNAVEYSGWIPGHTSTDSNAIKDAEKDICLSVQWITSSGPLLLSGLYWKEEKCESVGGYVCKRPHQMLGANMNFNKTINGSDGSLTTPNYPDHYYPNLDYVVKIIGPEKTRIIIKFNKIDIETQTECLYDYVEVKSVFKLDKGINDAIKLCGNPNFNTNKFDFVSETNEVEVKFHSDYSISGNGFSLTWQAVDVSSCPMQTLTAKEGVLTSPNYPDFLLPHLNCNINIIAPRGKRIWLDFSNSNLPLADITADYSIELTLGKQLNSFRPFKTEGLLTEGSFVSTDERINLKLQTGDHPLGVGFKAKYRITDSIKEEKVVRLSNVTTGLLLHVNYPDESPPNIDFLQHFIAPLGYIILLELYNVKLADRGCPEEEGIIEVYDTYADTNETTWTLCYDVENEETLEPISPVYISSFLNTLHLRQKNTARTIPLNGTVRVQVDDHYRQKLVQYKERDVEACLPNPCKNGGKCIEKKQRKYCQCSGHYTGLFCALTKCELDPCMFGNCELTDTSYKCHCKPGYIGLTCDQKRRPCEGNPCESRGTCIEKGEGFYCQCHAWWEGQKCEKRMLHIPYKPLSERMLHEPFWLGLMTVFVVMGVIGLVWCAKRHFPEKIEKLLAEEDGRNRSGISSLRSSSARDQLQLTTSGTVSTGINTAATPSPGPGSNPARSLFGRLGIRKPSILSLTSPHAGYRPATGRTFSLDDLLKPIPRRTPSPKKKRNNSTPTKKNAAEKKQILQQLISPVNRNYTKKVNLEELIQLNDIKFENDKEGSSKLSETKFGGNQAQSVLSDPKLEKKVTFARLLNKVSAEMSSGSEVELGIMQTNKLTCMFARPSSTPPSPSIDAIRSPNSTSSNQGSDSFTSSELAIPGALSSSISDLLINRRQIKLPNGRPKPSSADSILAMFRNFSSSSAGANLPASLKVSPSTTPTASSPQDDIVGDDESSSSSIPTPVSFSSGAPESPILQRVGASQCIEVPVLDTLSAHKSSSSGGNFLHPPTILLEIPSTINKCLSPIREMPTPLPSPMPSPALTPIMRRSTTSSSVDEADMSDDRISVEIPNISIGSDGDEEEVHCTDFAIDLQAEDGLILEEAAAMQHSSLYRNKHPPIGQTQSKKNKKGITITIDPPPLVIPTLIIQTPSPTHSTISSILFPGSPPPHRSSVPNESYFQFPPTKQSRRLLKDFDKPTSLDLPCELPTITVTSNMSEIESDNDSISPAIKAPSHKGETSVGMTYLSPFSMNARGEHTASESNLSSSGYSSMASPGPSRCNSSNPLCPSEMEDQGPHGSGGPHCRRQSLTPVLKPSSSSSGCGEMNKTSQEQRRGRSDSETLSDDPLIESNDEGIGTDHIDEKIDDGELKSAKELEVFMTTENENCKTLLDLPIIPLLTTPCVVKCHSLENTVDKLLSPLTTNNKNCLQLPAIVVQCDSPGCDKHLSPMSSRSESPLSDRTSGMGRFSPQFYGKHKDLLPFTDSDGLYDFPSSDKVNVTTCTHHKKTGRKREKKLLRSPKTPSPTKIQPPTLHKLLDIPSKDSLYKIAPPRKLSPKRRITRSQIVSSSSSSDSITSTRDSRPSSSIPSPDTVRWTSPVAWLSDKCLKSLEGSGEETLPDVKNGSSVSLPKTYESSKNYYGNHKKISKLRAISHQIRFLRRLEQSLKRRERPISPSDSCDSGEESPRATSPLLQPEGSKVEIRKSSSIGKLQNSNSYSKYSRIGRYRRDLLAPHEKQLKIIGRGNGYSD